MGMCDITRANSSGGLCIAQSTNATNPSQTTSAMLAVHVTLRLVSGFISCCAASLGRGVHFKISLRRNTECIRHPIEKSEHGRDVDGLGNLRLGPSVIAQLLHVLGSGAIRSFRHLCHVVQQRALSIAELRFVEFALDQRLYSVFFCSLNTQEVCMRVQSIWAAVQVGNPACDRLFGSPVQVTLGKMDGIAEPHHFAQKIGPMAEALENPRHVLPPGLLAPLLVDGCNFAGRLRVFDEPDLGVGVCHCSKLYITAPPGRDSIFRRRMSQLGYVENQPQRTSRRSPCFTVIRSRSKYSSSGIAYLRVTSASFLNAATSSCCPRSARTRLASASSARRSKHNESSPSRTSVFSRSSCVISRRMASGVIPRRTPSSWGDGGAIPARSNSERMAESSPSSF